MTRKEYRAQMRKKHGADWWKKSKTKAKKSKTKAKKRSRQWYEEPWPSFWGWLEPSLARPRGDSPYIVYGHVEDDFHISIGIYKRSDGFHVWGDSEQWVLKGDDRDVTLATEKIDKRGLTKAQAKAAVRDFVERAT